MLWMCYAGYLFIASSVWPVLVRGVCCGVVVVEVCNEMLGQEADQVERRRDSGSQRANHAVSRQH